MSDFDPIPEAHIPLEVPEDSGPVTEDLAVEAPPAIETDAAPSSTEPPPPVSPPQIRVTAEGVVLSKVVVSPEGVILKVLED